MSAPREVRGVLFDKDGTLIDLHASWVAAGLSTARRLCERAGAPARYEALVAGAGYDPVDGGLDPAMAWASGSTESLILRWIDELALARDRDLVTEMLEHMTREASLRVTPLTDLAGLFARLRAAGLRVGVAPMDLERSARACLAGAGALDLLDFVCGCDSGHGEKPSPGMVLAFCAACGLDPAEVWVVGDTPHDLHMARAAGAGAAIGVASGASAPALLAPIADRVIASVAELAALLDV